MIMKKILSILFLSVILFSCSAEEESSEGTLTIPVTFHGKWGNSTTHFAEIKTHSIFLRRFTDEAYRTDGAQVETGDPLYFRAELPNDEILVLILDENTPNDVADDVLGIALFIEGELVGAPTLYTRRY